MKFSNRLVKHAVMTYILVFIGVIQAQDEICKKLSSTPNFNLNYVLGKPWRFYYTWVVNMNDRCLEMTFERATRTIIDKIGGCMIEYMRENIEWDRATMVTSIVRTTNNKEIQTTKTIKGEPRETLMFPEKGKPGKFKGVPYLENAGFDLAKNSVPTSNIVLKLFSQGKFLVMADCNLGLAALMARANQTIYRSEILATARSILDLDGYPSCSEDTNENEIEGKLDDNKITAADLKDELKKNKVFSM